MQADLGDTTGGIKLLGDSVNVQVRAVGEAKQGHRIAVYSREAPDDSTRPTLDLIYTAPLPPRWDTSTRSQAP